MILFANRFNEVRLARNLTAQQMADFLDVELRTYRYYESGKREPSFEKLVRIADYLDVSLDYLLCRDDFYEKHFRP